MKSQRFQGIISKRFHRKDGKGSALIVCPNISEKIFCRQSWFQDPIPERIPLKDTVIEFTIRKGERSLEAFDIIIVAHESSSWLNENAEEIASRKAEQQSAAKKDKQKMEQILGKWGRSERHFSKDIKPIGFRKKDKDKFAEHWLSTASIKLEDYTELSDKVLDEEK